MARCVKFKNVDGRRVCQKYEDAPKRKSRKSDHALVGLRFGNFNPLNRGVNSTDVLVGSIAGIAGGFGIKYLISKYAASSVPAAVQGFLPFLGPAVTGLALSMAQKKSTPVRGSGHFVGAVAAGVAMQAWNYGKQTFPEFADYVALPLSRYGMLVQDNSNPFSLLVQDNTQNTLNELSAISAASDDDGMDELIG